jgi:hypothetical protein
MTNLKLKKSFLILCGILIVILFIWNRLFRERHEKIIPYQLENYTFLFLCFTCFAFLSSLFILILSKFNLVSFKETPLEFFIKSCLYELDFFIKKNIKDQRNIYEYVFNFCNKHLKKSLVIFTFFVFPKILLPIILLFEILLLNQIKIFYLSLWLLILPVLFRYIYHTLHCFYISILDHINSVLDVFIEKKINNTVYLAKITNNGIHYYVQEMVLYQLNIKKSVEIFTFEIKDKNNVKPLNYYIKNFLVPAFKYYRTLYIYTMHKKKYDFYLNVFSVSIYCFCWFYILLIKHQLRLIF